MKKAIIYILFVVNFFCCFSQEKNAVVETISNNKNASKIVIDTSKIEKITFKANFKSKYKSDDFNYEVKKDKPNAWGRFLEWLSGLLSKIFNFSNKQASINAVYVILKVLAILLILVVIYIIVKSLMNNEGNWIFGKNSDKKMIDFSSIEKNIQLVDFEKLISTTIASGQKRLAIRYYYLFLLKKMSDKQLIVWDLEKTNSDYLFEIKNQNQKDNFAYLSYLYNYIWYGEFEIDQNTFDKAVLSFNTTIQTL